MSVESVQSFWYSNVQVQDCTKTPIPSFSFFPTQCHLLRLLLCCIENYMTTLIPVFFSMLLMIHRSDSLVHTLSASLSGSVLRCLRYRSQWSTPRPSRSTRGCIPVSSHQKHYRMVSKIRITSDESWITTQTGVPSLLPIRCRTRLDAATNSSMRANVQGGS